MSTFYHADGWSVEGSSEAIMRLQIIIPRYEMLEKRYGEQLNNEIQEELEAREFMNERGNDG